MLKRNRFFVALLVLCLLAIPTIMAYTPSGDVTASLDTYGNSFWAGLICGAAIGAIIVGGGVLAAGTIGMSAAVAVSAGLHVAAVCAVI